MNRLAMCCMGHLCFSEVNLLHHCPPGNQLMS